MSDLRCNCPHSSGRISDKSGSPPEGIVAIWEEFKLPICISGAAIMGVVLYGKFGDKKVKNK